MNMINYIILLIHEFFIYNINVLFNHYLVFINKINKMFFTIININHMPFQNI